MAADPNVQVALISVITVTITTLGVIFTAFWNNRKERNGAASAGVEAGLDAGDVLERMLFLTAENERKEETISSLRRRNKALESEKRAVEEEVRMLKGENAQLILKTRTGGSNE